MDPVLYYLEEVPELITTQRFPEWWGSQVSEPPVIKLRGKSMLGRSAQPQELGKDIKSTRGSWERFLEEVIVRL